MIARPWALVPAAINPVALIGGWLIAAAVQPPGYDANRETISALAGHAAEHRWIMTAGLAVVGVCNILTAIGVPELVRGCRIMLAVIGVAGIGVAAVPQPAHGSAPLHITFATISIGLLAVWPLTVRTRHPATTALLRRSSAVAASIVLLALVGWLLAAGRVAAGVGTAERVATAAENAWPLVLTIALRRQAAKMPR